MSGPLGELDPHDADVARWAFLNPETGEWIEVKPGTVVLAASERLPVDPLREAAQAVVSGWIDDETGMQTFDPELIDRLADALASPAAPRNWCHCTDVICQCGRSPATPRPEGLDEEWASLRADLSKAYVASDIDSALATARPRIEAALASPAAPRPEGRTCARCGEAVPLSPDGTCWPCAVAYRDEIIGERPTEASALDVLYGFPKSYTEPEAAAWIAGVRAVITHISVNLSDTGDTP